MIITDGSEISLTEVTNVLNRFCSVSVLKINLDKSYLFLLGPLSNSNYEYLNQLNFNMHYDSVRYLGIILSHHKEDFFRLNYLPKLSRIKQLLHLWSVRDLTPIGKVLI